MDLPANLQAALWCLLRMLSPIPLVPVPFPFHPPGKVKYLGYSFYQYKGNVVSIHDCPLSKSTCKLLNRVVSNGTLRGVEGEGQISPIRFMTASAIFSASRD